MGQAPAATTGTLASKPLAHLFVYLLDKQLTGTLELRGGSEWAAIVVSRGHVAKVKTTAAVAYLGTVLYEQGAIGEGELNASLLEIARQKRPHGAVLLDRGSITRAQLADGLREQALRKLVYLFSLGPESTFAFHAGADLLPGYGGNEPVLTDPFPAIWRGVREHPSANHVRDILLRLGMSACRLVAGAQIDRFHFQPEELAAAECLRIKAHSTTQLVASGLLPPKTTENLLYCLLITKQLEILGPPVRVTVPNMPAVTGSMPPRSMSSGTVRVSAPAPTTTPPRSMSAPAHSRPVSRTDVPAASSAPSRAPSSDPRIGAELAQRAKMINERARSIEKEDMFQRLSLPRDASSDQVDDAFNAVARMWDPNELPPQLELAREDCAYVLKMLMEAHDTLSDLRKRGEYVRNLRVGKIQLHDPKEDLAASGCTDELEGAKACLAKGDIERAERLARRAHRAMPENGPRLALLAWLEAQKPTNQGGDATRQRITMLDRAIKNDPENEMAWYWRAQLHKRLEQMPLAVRDLKRVLRINPKNLDAERELRIAEMRARNSSSTMNAVRPSSPAGNTPSGGLLNRFLKK